MISADQLAPNAGPVERGSAPLLRARHSKILFSWPGDGRILADHASCPVKWLRIRGPLACAPLDPQLPPCSHRTPSIRTVVDPQAPQSWRSQAAIRRGPGFSMRRSAVLASYQGVCATPAPLSASPCAHELGIRTHWTIGSGSGSNPSPVARISCSAPRPVGRHPSDRGSTGVHVELAGHCTTVLRNRPGLGFPRRFRPKALQRGCEAAPVRADAPCLESPSRSWPPEHGHRLLGIHRPN
jgi:hypothetical protein